MSIHKARPKDPASTAEQPCAVCAWAVKRVPGGQGTTWVHVETGAVAAPGEDPEDDTLAAAIAAQEEHLKRQRFCEGRQYVSHKFETFRPKGEATSVARDSMWSACIVCGVTETPEDYQRKLVHS